MVRVAVVPERNRPGHDACTGRPAPVAPIESGRKPCEQLRVRSRWRWATDHRRGGAIAAAAIVFGGLAGVAVIEQSVDDTLSSPLAVGQPWDLELQEAPPDPDVLIAATVAEPIDVLALDLRLGGTDFVVSGEEGEWLVQPMTFENIVGDVAPFMLDGNVAADVDDVVLGEQLARRIGAELGSTVTFAPGPITFTVTGIGRLSDGDRADEFAFVTSDGLARLGQGQPPDLNVGVVRLGDDAGPALQARLVELGWKPALLPAKIATLEQIGAVPRSLAIGLTILGVGAVVHALLVTINRRRGDIAVARALGFVPRQAQATIGRQGTLTAVVGALVGLPVGVVVGRGRSGSRWSAVSAHSISSRCRGSHSGRSLSASSRLCAVCGTVVGRTGR